MTEPAKTDDAGSGSSLRRCLSRWPLLKPLAVRDFRLVWMGEGISLLGDQFYLVALAWLTLVISGSALTLATVLMAATVPRAVLMLLGGAITDRFSPREVMLLSNATRAVIVALLTGLVLRGAIYTWELYPVAVAFGTIDSVFFPAANAVVPLLLDERRLAAGTALTQTNYQVAGLIGPPLAGLLIARLGTAAGSGGAFAFDTLSFAFATAMLALVRGGKPLAHTGRATDSTKTGGIAGLLRSVGEGLTYAARDQVIRSLLLIIAAVDIAAGGLFNVGVASLARVRFGGGPVAFGAMLSASGAGSLLGILVGGSLHRIPRRGLVAVGVVTCFAAGYALLAIASTLGAAIAVIAVMSFASGISNVVLLPWLQMRTAPEMMGRVVSLFTFASVALSPISYPIAGVLAERDVTLDFAAASAIVLAAAIFAAATPSVRRME